MAFMAVQDVGELLELSKDVVLILRIGRWLFIIDGIITLPLALLGYVFFPNLPQDGKRTWWLTDREQQMSQARMKAIGRAGKEPWTKAKLKRILSSWHFYLLRTFSSVDRIGRTKNNSYDSYVLCRLEQFQLTKRNGILAEELQREPSPCSRSLFHGPGNQSTYDQSVSSIYVI